jgi:hypothetical protein
MELFKRRIISDKTNNDMIAFLLSHKKKHKFLESKMIQITPSKEQKLYFSSPSKADFHFYFHVKNKYICMCR